MSELYMNLTENAMGNRIEMLTVQEATEQLRSMGMRISPDTVRDGLEQGQYPFGTYIKSRNGGNVYYIYKRLFNVWVAERAM